METIATRIIKLCDVLNISKSDFARRINVTPSYISKLGKATESVPSERTIDDICRVFGVSKLWLKTGEGEMYVKRDLTQEIGVMVTALMTDADESFRKRFIEALLPGAIKLRGFLLWCYTLDELKRDVNLFRGCVFQCLDDLLNQVFPQIFHCLLPLSCICHKK